MDQTPNVSLFREVMAQIEDHPEMWLQNEWVTFSCEDNMCGTSFCFAGWAVVLSGLVNPKTGEPTPSGYEFVKRHHLFEPFLRDVEINGEPVRKWQFPYEDAASILLGIRYEGNFQYPNGRNGHIFGRYSAKPDSFDEWSHNYGDPLPDDDINVFKRRVTQATGVTFPPRVVAEV